jgi:hypothetical protein
MPKFRALLVGLVLLTAAMSAAAQKRQPADLKPLPASLSSDVLERFSGEAEFRRYLRDVKREAKKRNLWWAARRKPVQLAQNQAQDVTCLKPEDCPEDAAPAESIVVTGAKAATPSITNVQEAGVDEGDIVKQIGQYLLVLQDGRIFVVDMKAKGLALVDRANVYRDPNADTWYDEMLVQEDHILITGYSYREEASEVSVFRLSPEGKLASEGVFLLSSNDYYDADNYATRLVGDKLVVYTPLSLEDVSPDRPFVWPVVRRWLPEDQREKVKNPERPLFDASKIYKPVRPTIDPAIHTMSVCPIGPVRKGSDMRCYSTAVIAPSGRQFYVTPTDFYLWATSGWGEYEPDRWGQPCNEWSRRAAADAHPAMLFRMPLTGAEPTALAAKGVPVDQFSFDVSGGRFRALLGWVKITCDGKKKDDDSYPLADWKLLDVPLSLLSDQPGDARAGAYAPLPAIGTNAAQNRFTDKYLVYGGGERWGRNPPYDDSEPPQEATVVAVPLKAPERATTLKLPHGVARLERLGNDAILTGYRDAKGLSVSILDLRAAPALKPPLLLPRRYESEGRSHAFNSRIEADGHGLFGLPTVAVTDGNRWWSRSENSDVSFFALDANRNAATLGELAATPEEKAADTGYECEVSCIDWYGNTRPIFTEGRVFALAATELVEGRVEGDRIVEVQRLNLSQPFPPVRK